MARTPTCIGIILDGNRRWAVENNVPKLQGHRKGFELMKDCTRWVRNRGIPHLAVYAFSTENWNRSDDEVSYLMDLFMEMATRSTAELAKDGIRIRFIGQRERFSPQLQKAIAHAEEISVANTELTLWICLSYGSRAEIVAAAQNTAKAGEEITEESLRKHFWSAEMPDLDLIIRPGGDQRLSNFLLWQAAYAELFFIKPFWPDFSETELDRILREYAARERRMGK